MPSTQPMAASSARKLCEGSRSFAATTVVSGPAPTGVGAHMSCRLRGAKLDGHGGGVVTRCPISHSDIQPVPSCVATNVVGATVCLVRGCASVGGAWVDALSSLLVSAPLLGVLQLSAGITERRTRLVLVGRVLVCCWADSADALAMCTARSKITLVMPTAAALHTRSLYEWVRPLSCRSVSQSAKCRLTWCPSSSSLLPAAALLKVTGCVLWTGPPSTAAVKPIGTGTAQGLSRCCWCLTPMTSQPVSWPAL